MEDTQVNFKTKVAAFIVAALLLTGVGVGIGIAEHSNNDGGYLAPNQSNEIAIGTAPGGDGINYIGGEFELVTPPSGN